MRTHYRRQAVGRRHATAYAIQPHNTHTTHTCAWAEGAIRAATQAANITTEERMFKRRRRRLEDWSCGHMEWVQPMMVFRDGVGAAWRVVTCMASIYAHIPRGQMGPPLGPLTAFVVMAAAVGCSPTLSVPPSVLCVSVCVCGAAGCELGRHAGQTISE